MRIDLSRHDQWYTQRNNRIYPLEACTPTSVVMALDIEGLDFPWCPTGVQPEDHLMDVLRGPIGRELQKKLTPWWVDRVPPNQVHLVVAHVVNRLYGRRVARWVPEGPLKRVAEEISSGHPVVIGGSFAGLSHTVCVAGYDVETDELMLMDPFGDPRTEYRNQRGNDVWVPWRWLELRWAGHMHVYRHARRA